MVKYSDLPKHLVDALIATEDERFYDHSGIDGRGTMRAALKSRNQWRGEYVDATIGETVVPW